MPITCRRPIRSEAIAHGITARARPRVAVETLSAACASLMFRFRDISGSRPCTEYSCEKVARPLANSANSIPR